MKLSNHWKFEFTYTFTANLLLDGCIGVSVAGVDVDWLRWLGNDSVELVTANQLSLALVPGVKNLLRRHAANYPRVNKSWKLDSWDVAGSAVDTLEVPNRLGGTWVYLVQETSSIAAIKDTSETPRLILERLDISHLDK